MPLFDALVELASPPETDELICKISSSNDDEPVLGLLAAVLVGAVLALLLGLLAAVLVGAVLGGVVLVGVVLVGVVPTLLLTVDVPGLSAGVAEVVPELASPELELLATVLVAAVFAGVVLVGAVLVGVVPALLPTVDVPGLSAGVAELVPALAPPEEVAVCEPSNGPGSGAGTTWKSLKSV